MRPVVRDVIENVERFITVNVVILNTLLISMSMPLYQLGGLLK